MPSNIQFKRDPVLLAFALILAGGAFWLVHTGDISWKEAVAFLAGALALPGLFGAKPDDDTKPPTPPTDPTATAPVTE